jgi:hypothetical protein
VCPDVTSCEQGVERSAYVHVGEQLRLEDRAGDRSLRSLMENDVASLGCGSNGVHITKIRAYEAHAGRPIEIRPRALRQIVEAHDRVSFGEEPARQVRTDEPRSAGDERSHPSLPRAVGDRPRSIRGTQPGSRGIVARDETIGLLRVSHEPDRVWSVLPRGMIHEDVTRT